MNWSSLEFKKIGLWGMGREGQVNRQILSTHVSSATLIEISEDNLNDLYSCDVVVKSPGVCLYRPEVDELKRRNIPLTSGTNLFMANKNPRTRVVCITGTKGKSTTSALLAHTLKSFGLKVCLGGNIGVPLLSFVDEATDIVVVETSSYQCADFVGTPDLGILMALYSAHLPWHGTLERYHADKMNMIRQAKQSIDFSSCPIRVEQGMFYDQKPLFSVECLPLFGKHNQQNACVVLQAVKMLGYDILQCQSAFQSFQALPHRLEPVGTVNDVLYINDSIATLPEPVEAAIDTFSNRPITLIVGGWDGGYDYHHLNTVIQQKQVLAIALPVTGDQIDTPHHVDNMAQAVQLAHQLSQPGSVVLMSPGAPSYNLYKNFEERGADFKYLVQKLKG